MSTAIARARPVQPFQIIRSADAHAISSKQWVVRGLLAAGQVSALIGPPNSCKSALALDLAATIATDGQWFGRATKQGSALYFALERGPVTLRRRRAYELFHKVSLLNVGIVRDLVDLLNNGDDAERVIETVRQYERDTGEAVRFLVVDTARAAMPGGDENTGRDMGKLARHLGHIRDGAPNAHVMLLHHTPKGRPGEASGHTALAAMLDAVLVAAAKDGRGSWRVVEANDLQELPPSSHFDLQTITIGKDASGDPLTAPVVVPSVKAQALITQPTAFSRDAKIVHDVLTHLTNNGAHITVDQWRNATLEAFGDRASGAKRQAWLTARTRLIESGAVAVDGEYVSVSIPSVERQKLVSPDGCKRQRQASASPLLEGALTPLTAPTKLTTSFDTDADQISSSEEVDV
jgi:AAA domain